MKNKKLKKIVNATGIIILSIYTLPLGLILWLVSDLSLIESVFSRDIILNIGKLLILVSMHVSVTAALITMGI